MNIIKVVIIGVLMIVCHEAGHYIWAWIKNYNPTLRWNRYHFAVYIEKDFENKDHRRIFGQMGFLGELLLGVVISLLNVQTYYMTVYMVFFMLHFGLYAWINKDSDVNDFCYLGKDD